MPLCSFWANRMFPAEGYDPSALEAVQLEDGSTAYIHHPVAVPSDGAILAVQTEVGLEDLATEDDEGFGADTVVALEQYTSKVSSLDDRVSPVPAHGQGYSLRPPAQLPRLISHGSSSWASVTARLGPPTAVYTPACLCVSAEGRQL